MKPPIPTALMAYLKTTYPPRCRLPHESERDHERYAGMVDLVADLEEIHRHQVAPDVSTADIAEGLTFEDLYTDPD